MCLQKSKREQAVEDSDKTKILNKELMANKEKIKEKEKELKANWANYKLLWGINISCTILILKFAIQKNFYSQMRLV